MHIIFIDIRICWIRTMLNIIQSYGKYCTWWNSWKKDCLRKYIQIPWKKSLLKSTPHWWNINHWLSRRTLENWISAFHKCQIYIVYKRRISRGQQISFYRFYKCKRRLTIPARVWLAIVWVERVESVTELLT